MEETTLAYAGGLIDGEGTITLCRDRPNSNRVPSVSIASTSYELLLYIKDNFGGHISSKKTSKQHYKESWSWCLRSNKAIIFLQGIAPYLQENKKIKRANFIIDNYKNVTVRNGKYTEEQLKIKKQFEEDFFNL